MWAPSLQCIQRQDSVKFLCLQWPPSTLMTLAAFMTQSWSPTTGWWRFVIQWTQPHWNSLFIIWCNPRVSTNYSSLPQLLHNQRTTSTCRTCSCPRAQVQPEDFVWPGGGPHMPPLFLMIRADSLNQAKPWGCSWAYSLIKSESWTFDVSTFQAHQQLNTNAMLEHTWMQLKTFALKESIQIPRSGFTQQSVTVLMQNPLKWCI